MTKVKTLPTHARKRERVAVGRNRAAHRLPGYPLPNRYKGYGGVGAWRGTAFGPTLHARALRRRPSAQDESWSTAHCAGKDVLGFLRSYRRAEKVHSEYRSKSSAEASPPPTPDHMDWKWLASGTRQGSVGPGYSQLESGPYQDTLSLYSSTRSPSRSRPCALHHAMSSLAVSRLRLRHGCTWLP